MNSMLLVCVVAAALLGTVHSQSTCTLPTAPTIATLIAKIINSGGGEGGVVTTVTVVSFHFTCIAVGPTENTVDFLSVAVVYNRNDSGTITPGREQFQFSCSGNNFDVANSMPVESNPPAEAFTVATRRDCFTCSAQTGISFVDEITNCAFCTACQNVGQGFCTGQMTCCPFYQGGDCIMNCTDNRVADATTNFTCVCMAGFAEDSSGMCVDVCDPSPCQNNGTCSFVGNSATCNCPMGFTGANCETVVVPEPSSTPTPSATPVTSPPATSPPCPDNCRQCNSAGCCTQCENRFELMSGSSCPRCVETVCSDGCNTCFNSTCCRECLADYQLEITGNTCTCKAIRVPDSAAVAAGIAIGVVLFVLLLLALAILAAYLIYAAVTHGTDSKRTKSHMPFGNGDAHDNPLYINPKELDDDEP